MPYANDGADDFEKLKTAFAEITGMFGSVDSMLDTFGLSEMPLAQRYGIMFGIVVFALTVSTVLALLVLGGSFQRISEQAHTGQATLLAAHDARTQRALLLEKLLEAQERMLKKYLGFAMPKDVKITELTKMLLNEAPPKQTSLSPTSSSEDVEKESKAKDGASKEEKTPKAATTKYEENYVLAYRTCQDRPGGAILSGRPEARFEAYARGYAGCGVHFSTAYRRSYARMYESHCCHSHKTDDKYVKMWNEQPENIVGKTVYLEALDVDRHLSALYEITNGEPAIDHKGFDPQEVWSFLPEGPFANELQLKESFVFNHKPNQAAFAMYHSVTEKLLGVVMLQNDDPANLSIELDPPIVAPSAQGKQAQMEACFLLMDRLFALGYRRIQCSVDSADSTSRKLATRLGFTLEGVLYKHQIVKESNRDSAIYGMLNSDWKRGARNALFKKLYGAAAFRADSANEKREEELEEQQRVLAEKKLKELEGTDGGAGAGSTSASRKL